MPDASTAKDPRFNPLCAWLGFPPNALPRDYYALLGLPRFESNTSEINRAADTLIAHVREIRPGPYLTEWTQLLDTIRAAKTCLCDPEKKQAYDEALRSHHVTSLDGDGWPTRPATIGLADSSRETRGIGDVAAPGLSTSLSSVSPNPSYGGLTTSETIAPSVAIKAFPRRKKPHTAAQIFSICLLSASIVIAYQMLTAPAWWGARFRAILAGAQLGLNNQGQGPVSPGGNTISQDSRTVSNSIPEQPSSPSPSAPAQSNDPPLTPPLGETPPPATSSAQPIHHKEHGNPTFQPPVSQSSLSTPPATGDNGPDRGAERPNHDAQMPTAQEGEEQVPSEMPPTAEPPMGNELAVHELRPELRSGIDQVWQAMAKREIEAARSKLDQLAGQVANEAEQQAVEALDYLLKHVEEFWRTLQRIVSSLQAGEEFAIGDAYIVVVDANSEELVIRAAGENRRYLIRQMPTPLVRLIASRRFRPGVEADALLGAFLAVDPGGSPQEAEQLWRRANDGILDVEALLQALKLRPGSSAR